jgi:hypothetical protein
MTMINDATIDAPTLTLDELESQLAEPLPARELMGYCGGCDGLRVSLSLCLSVGVGVRIG